MGFVPDHIAQANRNPASAASAAMGSIAGAILGVPGAVAASAPKPYGSASEAANDTDFGSGWGGPDLFDLWDVGSDGGFGGGWSDGPAPMQSSPDTWTLY